MKFKKLILPMMVFVCAIGMAFATVDIKPELEPISQDYVLINGSWDPIPEQNCNPGSETCRVQFGQGGPIYDVYDEMDEETLKSSTSPKPTIINP